MLRGTTESGFRFEVEDKRLNDMELLELMAEMDEGNSQVLPKVVGRVLGDEQKRALYEHVRQDGVVPIDRVAAELAEILRSGNQGKN